MTQWLVTGGEGFIGGRIVALSHANSFDLKSGKDVLDTETLTAVCSGVTGIFHCAAKISVPESIEMPEEYYLHNVTGTQSVIQAARQNNSKIVFSSSAAVYGESNKPVLEIDRLNPLSPYAENKIDGEVLLAQSGLPHIILRYFNVYGPGQSTAYAGVITAFIQAALANKDLVIYGSGEQVRDFVFVDDVARANIQAMESNLRSGIFNIGSGTQTSVREIAEEIIKLTCSSSTIRYEPERPGDIVYSQANVTRAQTELGWAATISLEEGLRTTIDFYRNK